MGELERIEAAETELAIRKAHLLTVRDSLTLVGATLGIEQLQRFLPAVRAHRSYGGRGVLTGWLRELLQAAAPHWVDTPTLVDLAEREFDLAFPTYVQRDAYRNNTLGRALRKLQARGVVERSHDPDATSSPGLWRWKGDGAAELLQAAAGLEAT